MFAEELSNNTARKKAEENRARRKRIQQQQQQQQQQQKASNNNNVHNNQNQNFAFTTTSITPPTTALFGTTTATTTSTSTTSTTSGTTTTTTTSSLFPTTTSTAPPTSSNNDNNTVNNSNDNNNDSENNVVPLSPVMEVVPSTNNQRILPNQTTIILPTPTTQRLIPSTTSTIISTTNTTTITTSSNNNTNTIIERTKYERQLRTIKNIQNKSILVIQSKYRQYIIYKKTILPFIEKQLMNQLHDLNTLSIMLKKNNNTNTTTNNKPFIPPITTTTSFLRQLLFLTFPPLASTTCSSKNMNALQHERIISILNNNTNTITSIHLQCLHQILELCIIPSLINNTNNAILQWIQQEQQQQQQQQQHHSDKNANSIGKIRFQRLLQLCTLAIMHVNCTEIQLQTILQFIHLVLNYNTNNGNTIKRICRSYIFPTIVATSTNNNNTNNDTNNNTNNNNNQISLLVSVWSSPIDENNIGNTTTSTSSSSRYKNGVASMSSSTTTTTNDNNINKNQKNYTLKDTTTTTTTGDDNDNDYCSDWILLIRHYLLFYQRRNSSSCSIQTNTGSKNKSIDYEKYRPIPSNVESTIISNHNQRNNTCFPVIEKYRANHLLHFLFQQVQNHNNNNNNNNDDGSNNKNDDDYDETFKTFLRAKIVTHIFTIPLLTWRIASTSTTKDNKKSISLPHQQQQKDDDDEQVIDAISTLIMIKSSPSSKQQQQQYPLFIQLLQSFIKVHIDSLNYNNNNKYTDNNILLLLPTKDVPMTLCPATPSQCLLGNLIQIGRICPALNPQQLQQQSASCYTNNNFFSFLATSYYLDVLSSFIDIVPLSTYTTRESSAVEWIDDGYGHLKPIILSNVILEQCKGILVDSYIRRLFLLSMDDKMFKIDIENILITKNEKDNKYEKEMMDAGGIEFINAASLAAKEARIDKNKSFWNSSKWATKLAKGVSNLLSNSNDNKTSLALKNTSTLARDLAEGKNQRHSMLLQLSSNSNNNNNNSDNKSSSESFTLDLFLSLCRIYSIFLARWGGSGYNDILSGRTNKKDGTGGGSGRGKSTNTDAATVRAEPFTLSLLNVLCFSTPIVRILWGLIQRPDNQNYYTILSDIQSVIDAEKGKMQVRAQSICPIYRVENEKKNRKQQQQQQTQLQRNVSNNDGAVVLYMFLCTFSHVLIITDDVEIHDMDKPLPMHQIRRCILVLKKLLYRAACVDPLIPENVATSPSSSSPSTVTHRSTYFGNALIASSSRTMRDLYDRSSRKPFCLPSMWTVPNLLEREVGKCKSCSDYLALLASTPVLRVCPFLVSFKLRLKLFERIITTNRIEVQGENSANPFHNNPLKPGLPIRITRGRILEDGLITMNNLGPSKLRQRIQVNYYNEAGMRETGIDAGGLFKDFWTDLCAIAFNPNYALFQVTETGTAAGHCLYPNPLSKTVHGSADHITLFEFLGRILGKALYEGITISPRFAHFFLSFLRGDYNFLHMLPDLSTVDPQLYNNLMFLKNYDGDCSDLCLTFTVTTDDFGGTKETPLIPNGGNVEVTNENKQRYIGLVAKYYVFDRLKEQSEAFTRGLWDVLDRSWLQLFNEPELQVLISGVAEGKLDIEDMKANVQYVGGYSSMDRTISKFWSVVASLTTKQQADLLRFVTGCERPPPLGFSSMNPPFTIQRVGTGGGLLRGDGDRLPSASTCFNVLKLPAYSSEKVLKERLIYAIESGAGFELT